jgi:CarD family transcriptional regulator
MEFKIGDIVVEPSIGICKIEGIRQMPVDGEIRTFYVFHAANNASVMVPTNQIEKRGVRRPMAKEDARKVMTVLKTPAATNRNDAKMQYTHYREILNSGDPTRIAKLLRDLHTLDQTNELKGKEKEIMEQARTFLVNEISHIKDESKTKISDDITDSLRQMYKKKVQKDRELRKKNSTPIF